MKHATNILLTDLPDSLRQPCSLKGPYVSRNARPHNATMSWLINPLMHKNREALVESIYTQLIDMLINILSAVFMLQALLFF